MTSKRNVLRMAVGTCLMSAAGAVHGQDDIGPVIAQTKAGPCRMTVSGEGSSFLIVVTGLQPNEPLKITSNSEGEVGSWDSHAQDDGRYATIVIPLVKGKTFGTASLEVVGRKCRIEASYPWKE